MVIFINKVLEYYYSFINSNQIVFDENNYFKFKDKTYLLHKIKKERNNILSIVPNSIIHSIIKNRYNEIITIYNNDRYVLLKVNVINKNRELLLDDIINISKIPIRYENIYKKNYFIIWKEKIDYLEKYYSDQFNYDYYDFYYYIGMSYNALHIINKINYNNISYGISFNRFDNIKTLYDLYNPFNIEYGPLVVTYSEYIKYCFFYKDIKLNISPLFDLKLSIDDYYFFMARLIFPTYYFDLLDNKIENSYNIIINRIEDYILFLKEINNEIKKRHINMSYIELIINQL